jgi:hypothetical protein
MNAWLREIEYPIVWRDICGRCMLDGREGDYVSTALRRGGQQCYINTIRKITAVVKETVHIKVA